MFRKDITRKEIILFTIISSVLLMIPFFIASNIPTERNVFEMTFFWKMIMEYSLIIIFFILHYFFLIPQFYYKRKYVYYGLSVGLIFLIYIYLPTIIIDLLPFEQPSRGSFKKNRDFRRFPLYFIWSFKILIFVCTSFVSLLLRNNKRLEEVKEEKQLSEIAYLRAQINPHFLFNTLNNIYALTLQKSDLAPDAVMKLSKMMRFMVTDSSKDEVKLQQDLDYIKNYIQLQKMRLSDSTTIEYSVVGSTSELKIAPLLLINFIENAFKYGVVDDVKFPIKISISIIDNELELHVSNKISDHKLREDEKSMTGLMNVKKRLEYLYGNRYHLDIEASNDFYDVKLNLKLND